MAYAKSQEQRQHDAESGEIFAAGLRESQTSASARTAQLVALTD